MVSEGRRRCGCGGEDVIGYSDFPCEDEVDEVNGCCCVVDDLLGGVDRFHHLVEEREHLVDCDAFEHLETTQETNLLVL